MNEIWKDIKGYEGVYEVSNLGKVKNVKTGRILKIMHDHRGYPKLGLRNNGVYKTHKIHRLVAITFLNNPYNLPVINHIDGNKKNNAVENLEWCTQAHNVRHSFNLGLNSREKMKLSERKPTTRFNEDIIEEMVLYKDSHSYGELCEKYKISEDHAVRIITKGRVELELKNLKNEIRAFIDELEHDFLEVHTVAYCVTRLKRIVK